MAHSEQGAASAVRRRDLVKVSHLLSEFEDKAERNELRASLWSALTYPVRKRMLSRPFMLSLYTIDGSGQLHRLGGDARVKAVESLEDDDLVDSLFILKAEASTFLVELHDTLFEVDETLGPLVLALSNNGIEVPPDDAFGDAQEFDPSDAVGVDASRENRWPWGAHQTELLGHMAEAARRYWSNFDPADPTTAPTNADVTAFLMHRGVSSRIAEAMAQILRADGLRPGPRPGSRKRE